MGRELDDGTGDTYEDQQSPDSDEKNKRETKVREPNGNPLLSGGPLFD